MDLLQGLNPQQYEAAAHVDGPLLILAGAGSGKTRVITHRITSLICEKGVPAWSILAVTFTNKAAEEMRNRIAGLLNKAGAAGAAPAVATFHSFCVRLLRKDGTKLADIRAGFTRQFTIYDDDDQVSLIKSIYKAIGLDEKFMPYRGALSRISHAKNHKETPQEFYKGAADPKMARLAVIYEKYEERLRQANALDFDDLLLETVRLLHHDADVRNYYNDRIRYLLIDEYQDTNRSQYELMRLLTQKHQNVCVVGDEDQSIYGWRGADIRNILDFEHDYPKAKVIRLEQNYRSTKNILEAASAVVANNKERKDKWLWTESQAGDKVNLYEAMDGENEALFIADTIERVLHQHKEWKIAILYRTNFQSRQIEEALRRYGRKYVVVGGFSFYQRAEIKDILSYLKAASSPNDSISLLRVINTPARGIGKTTLDQLEQFALNNNLSLWSAINRLLQEQSLGARAEASLSTFKRIVDELAEATATHKVDELLRLVLDRTGYQKMLESDPSPDAETRMGNISELLNAASEAVERGEDLAAFLDHAALVSDADNIDLEARVSLLTMHNAKGLEFPVVFIAGLEEGLFPHSRSLDSPSQMEEERRLCYVGLTRAEKQLYLSWARYRRRYGGGEPERSIASRFLTEVPPSLLNKLRGAADIPQVDLLAERSEVRESAKRNLYTGKTYNSVDNISQYFSERGVTPKGPAAAPPPRPALRDIPQSQRGPLTLGNSTPAGPPRTGLPSRVPTPPVSTPQPSARLPQRSAQSNMFDEVQPPAPPAPVQAPSSFDRPAPRPVASPPSKPAPKPQGIRNGSIIYHPKYGKGTVMRREGDGEDAKLTVSFPGYGLKKIIEKYANSKANE